MNYGLPEMHSARLILRPFEAQDFDELRRLETDADVVRYLGNGKVRDEDQTRVYLQKHLDDYETHGLGLYAVVEIETGYFVGRSGLIPWEVEGKLEWEIGYTLAKNFWGRGYATELADFLKSWAFSNMDTQYLISLINPDNSGSIRVATKIGMKFWKSVNLGDHDLAAFRVNKVRLP